MNMSDLNNAVLSALERSSDHMLIVLNFCEHDGWASAGRP
jgi:hypothetical protein